MKVTDSKKQRVMQVLDGGRMPVQSINKACDKIVKEIGYVRNNMIQGLKHEDDERFTITINTIRSIKKSLDDLEDACEIFEEDFR